MAIIRMKRVWVDFMRCILDCCGLECLVFAMVVLRSFVASLRRKRAFTAHSGSFDLVCLNLNSGRLQRLFRSPLPT